MGSKERLGKADATGVGIEQVQVRFEKFLRVGGNNIFHAGWSEVITRAEIGRSVLRLYKSGVIGRRTLADGGAEVTTVAHEEERGNRLERVQQAKDAALELAYAELEGVEQRKRPRDPVRRLLHFIFEACDL